MNFSPDVTPSFGQKAFFPLSSRKARTQRNQHGITIKNEDSLKSYQLYLLQKVPIQMS
jgi:hypothetical protein